MVFDVVLAWFTNDRTLSVEFVRVGFTVVSLLIGRCKLFPAMTEDPFT